MSYRLKTDPKRYEMHKKPTEYIPPENPAERIALLKEAPKIMAEAIKKGWAKWPEPEKKVVSWQALR